MTNSIRDTTTFSQMKKKRQTFDKNHKEKK